MSTEIGHDFSNVFWIGGPPDAGKSTVADLLGLRHGLAVYHYDSTDLPHHVRLAAADPDYLAFVNASMDERWVRAEPEELFERSLAAFRDRWPMVLEDLVALGDRPVVAEGFGLTPELVSGVAPPNRGVFLVPTRDFRAASVAARDKPAWRHETSDPDRARHNLLTRDDLLAAHTHQTAERLGYRVIEVHGGTRPIDLAIAVGEWLDL